MSEQKEEVKTTVKTVENSNGKNKLVIDSFGGRINSLILKGKKILGIFQRGDGKEGSSHPCIPQFGLDMSNQYNLPQHGSARNQNFDVKTVGDKNIFSSKIISEENYPDGLGITQQHNLDNEEYFLTSVIRNAGKEELPVNFAEHFYWFAPNGWKGIKINGVDVTEVVKSNGSIDILDENMIEIPGQEKIILTQKEFSKLHLWADKDPKTGKYDKNYVCIEPTQGEPERFGTTESKLKPGETKVLELSIKIDE